jgi:hypothetical protein
LGQRITRRGDRKELDDLSRKCGRKLLQHGNRWIFETAFEPAHVGAVDPGIRGKRFL